jgi:hypothetical protein
MRPLFTIHGGEYLVGSHIEQHFKRVKVWVPSRDTGIDLLVSDHQNNHTVSLQVKFSKDYLVTDMPPTFQKQLRACSYLTIDAAKLRKSPADFWVFVLFGFEKRTTDFVIVPAGQLWRQLRKIHGSTKTIRNYLWVTKHDRCWETRGLRKKALLQIVNDKFRAPRRDFKKWLNNWGPVAKLNR